jgi:hypothetical protein
VKALAKLSKGRHSVATLFLAGKGQKAARRMLLFRQICFRLCLPGASLAGRGRKHLSQFSYKSSKEKPDVFVPMLHKPLFHEVQQEMLTIVKSQAYWPYVGFRVSGLIARGGMMLAFAMLLCYIILGLVMQRAANVGPDETKKLAEAIVPYVLGFMGAGIVAGFFYEHLWGRLQPVVRAAARGIQG